VGRGRRKTENVGMFRVHAEQERQHNSFLEEEVDEMRKTVQISAIDRDETNRTNLARHRSSEIEWEEILAETVEGRECAKFDIYHLSQGRHRPREKIQSSHRRSVASEVPAHTSDDFRSRAPKESMSLFSNVIMSPTVAAINQCRKMSSVIKEYQMCR